MKFPELLPILDRLVEKYRDVTYEAWKALAAAGDRFNDYSEDEQSANFFWQAHTEVLEFESNNVGNYAHVTISIYPEGVHSVPPAPTAGMLVYESGFCDIGTPEREYLYDQKSCKERSAT